MDNGKLTLCILETPERVVCCISSGSALFAMINEIFRDLSTHLIFRDLGTHLLRKPTCDPIKHITDNPILYGKINLSRIKSKNSLQIRQPHLQDLTPLQDSITFSGTVVDFV